MPQIQLDDICPDELYCLQKSIDSYLNAQNAAERAYCEGSLEYEEIEEDCQALAQKMKQHVRALATALGIHKEFLDEYAASCQRNGLKLVAA